MLRRLGFFLNPFDARYEDLRRGSPALNVLRDFTAGLIVAMVAIPLAMGFAMASGLRPEQGIVGGAVAGLIGALWGGSKYQVYGPTAAYIPVIAAIVLKYDHAFLVLCSIVAGLGLMALGLARLGRIVAMVPHSIVVGFTIGIAATIALSQIGEVLGLKASLGYSFFAKVMGLAAHAHEANGWAVLFAFGTLLLTKSILKVSVYIPAPLIALGIGTALAGTVLSDAGLSLIKTKFGAIPAQAWKITPPAWPDLTPALVLDVLYFATAILFVAAIESLLCSRMADRLAGNKGTPYHADKELWGQGLVNIFVPLVNGFPHTGALARTATNIKLGAVSPLAGIFKCVLKLLLAFYLASWLELVPMACIGGILMFVAMNMVKPAEVREALAMGKGHTLLMAYTAAAVIVTDFLTGVLTAIVIYAVAQPRDASQPRPPALVRTPRRHGKPAAPALPAYSHAEAHGHEKRSLRPEVAEKKVRAVLDGDRHGEARRPGHFEPVSADRRSWLSHIRQRPHIPRTAFVHEQATIIGKVVLGDHVHIAAGASVRADEGSPFFVGPSSNVQDGVVLHALKHRYVRVGGEEWAIYVGRGVSLAHGALVHGPCYVGDGSFVGFKAVVHDAVVGARSFVGIGALVVGVEVPEGRHVPHGAIVDTQEKADALAEATEQHLEFNEDVVEVNRGLAAAYREHGGAVERIDRGGREGAPCSCGAVTAGPRRERLALASGATGFGSPAPAAWDRF